MSATSAGGRRPVPMESASRCALQAQLRGDPMIGTAPPARRLLLVEQSGPWGPRGLVDSRADPRVAQSIDELAAAAGMRLQAIRRPGRHALGVQGHRVAVADVRPGVTRTVWWSVAGLHELIAQLERARPLEDSWLPEGAVEDREPVLLVCTHGRHDACCALRGRPLVTELHQVRPGRVWETTHLGGDRFAANLLVLPTGELYGRVLPFAAADLVEVIDRGEVVPGLLRGRLGLPPIAQAAVVFAHERLAVTARDAMAVRELRRVSDELALVTLQSPHGLVVVEIAMGWSEPEHLTCRGPSASRARTYRGVTVRAVS